MNASTTLHTTKNRYKLIKIYVTMAYHFYEVNINLDENKKVGGGMQLHQP